MSVDCSVCAFPKKTAFLCSYLCVFGWERLKIASLVPSALRKLNCVSQMFVSHFIYIIYLVWMKVTCFLFSYKFFKLLMHVNVIVSSICFPSPVLFIFLCFYRFLGIFFNLCSCKITFSTVVSKISYVIHFVFFTRACFNIWHMFLKWRLQVCRFNLL